jgi:epoxyqueuosine reductase
MPLDYAGNMDAAWSPELIAWLKARAVAAGFDLAGVAAAPSATEPDGTLTAERFESWLAEGRAGEMDYLKRRSEQGELLRRSARVAMPWARSVVVCAFNYNAEAPKSIDPAPEDTGWIARYAWNGDADGNPTDYHTDLLRRLRLLEAELLERIPCQTKSFVDTGPLLERDFAARAGVGWIGKNTCVLNQQLGSWLLLGVIVTSLELPAAAALSIAPDRCGSCTRCIDACPTDALIAPHQMDASRCIAYLTIELKGSIPAELREPIGRQVFGCDICQDVCPWNRRAPAAEKEALRTRPELVNPPLAWLASLDDAGFKREFKGSPLERTKRRRIQRNVAIAMGNSGDATFTPQLQAWAAGNDQILAESAAWALHRLNPATDD